MVGEAGSPSRSDRSSELANTETAQARAGALAAYRAGDLAKAEAFCRGVLRTAADDFDALNLLGVIAARTGRPGEAAALLERALAQRPDSASIHNNLGQVLTRLERFDDALASFDRALRLRPEFAGAHYNRGLALQQARRFGSAVQAYERAIAIEPGFADAWVNRGVALEEMQQLEAALASFDRAIALRPDLAEAHLDRGNVLRRLGQVDRAIDAYDRVIALEPDRADAYVNKAQALLLRGDLPEGWALNEWRLRTERGAMRRRDLPQPRWLGQEPLRGRTILLYAEQGFGDTLQFCRYATLAAAAGARVLLEVPGPLVSLLASLEGVERVVAQGEALPEFDLHSPLMSLPLAFRTELASIPAPRAYLKADPAKARHWRDRLGPREARLRVGLVWSSGHHVGRPELWNVNECRNIDLDRLAALKNDRVEFVSLQKGEPAESDLARLRRARWNGPEIAEFGAQLRDFSDTAALAENLDLVISVDTSVAHLAGALGRPVWILNRFDTCWRWLMDREDSPWYPTARIYRQRRPGEWDGVVERLRVDLAALVA